MNLHVSLVRTSLLVSVAALTCCFVPMTRAQQDPDADSNTAATAKFPAAKRPPGQRTTVANTNAQTTKAPKPEKDGADTIRKREQWFYKPRASANGHIPAGARLRALQHMQRMMLAEGKLVERPDGSFANCGATSANEPSGRSTSLRFAAHAANDARGRQTGRTAGWLVRRSRPAIRGRTSSHNRDEPLDLHWPDPHYRQLFFQPGNRAHHGDRGRSVGPHR